MTNKNNEDNLKERVNDMSTRVFTIAGIPERDFQRFIKFCEMNAKATKIYYLKGKRQVKEELIYSIALKQLLDAYEADAKVQMLYDRIVQLEDKFIELKVKLDKSDNKESEKNVIKTLGPK